MSIYTFLFRNKDDSKGKKIVEQIFGTQKTVRMLPIIVFFLLMGSTLAATLQDQLYRGLIAVVVFAGFIMFAAFCIFKIIKFLLRDKSVK